MSETLQLIFDFWSALINKLSYYTFSVYGVNVSLFAILIGFLLTSICITVFWKGGRG